MKALPRSSLLLGVPLLLALLSVFVSFLYAVFFGAWMPFAWTLLADTRTNVLVVFE